MRYLPLQPEDRQAMLGVIGQGLENSVYVMRHYIAIKNTTPFENGMGKDRHDPRLYYDQELVDCDLPRKTAH